MFGNKAVSSEKEIIVTSAVPASLIEGNNRIYGAFPGDDYDIKLIFKGGAKNNIVHFAEGIKVFKNTRIVFEGEGSVIVFCGNVHKYSLHMTLKGGNTCYFGENLFMNGTSPLNAVLEKGQNLFIGKNCLFSLNTRMFADGDAGGDILIGNQVWLGQNASIKGGVTADSGAVIGASAVADAPRIPSHTCWAERDGEFKQLKEGIIYTGHSVRNVPFKNRDRFSHIPAEYLDALMALTETNDFDTFSRIRNIRSPGRRYRKLLKELGDVRTYKVPKWKPAQKIGDDADVVLPDNRIEGNYIDCGGNSIRFIGRGNVLIIDDGIRLKNCRILFKGDNSIVRICSSKSICRMIITMHCDTTLFIGRDAAFNAKGKPISISVAECRCVLIGDRCSFGRDAWIRTSDQHAMYDIKTHERINHPRSVLIGNNTAIADEELILKGRRINFDEDGALLEEMIKIRDAIDSMDDVEGKIELLEELREVLDRS